MVQKAHEQDHKVNRPRLDRIRKVMDPTSIPARIPTKGCRLQSSLQLLQTPFAKVTPKNKNVLA